MKIKNIVTIGIVFTILNSCLGDRQTVIGADLGNTSFVNKNFKSNLISYEEGMSACDNITASTIAKLYDRSPDDIIILDPAKSDRYEKRAPTCTFHVKMSDQKFDHLTGTITILKEIKPDEFMGDVAEATGTGENWEEAWALKKSFRKNTEWLSGMGQAALWTEKLRKLEIKFEGYTIEIIAPGGAFNQIEKAKNRDYKSIAIAMAKASGFTN